MSCSKYLREKRNENLEQDEEKKYKTIKSMSIKKQPLICYHPESFYREIQTLPMELRRKEKKNTGSILLFCPAI